MIDQFGQVMVYVDDVRKVADFWIQQVDFIEVNGAAIDEQYIFVELTPNEHSDTHLVLYDKAFVSRQSPELTLASPSILFSTYDIKTMHQTMKDRGVPVSDIQVIGGMTTFHFPDIEQNYFAVREVVKKTD